MYQPRGYAVTRRHQSGAYASVVADSISPEGIRLTTIEARFHRFVLAEFNTHRVFSRNSASSRAIPVSKQLDRMEDDLAWPVEWPSEQKGMQGGVDLDAKTQVAARLYWTMAAEAAGATVRLLSVHPKLGSRLHKSVSNRLLEPFMWHTVIVTSTSWGNFIAQRCSPLAQPEIRAVADCIHEVLDISEPEKINEGEWHLPYIDIQDLRAARDAHEDGAIIVLREVSAARCARVSYLTHDGHRDHEVDRLLYLRLLEAEPMHASPLEHVATPAAWNSQAVSFVDPDSSVAYELGPVPKLGNHLGWLQWRHVIEARQGISSHA